MGNCSPHCINQTHVGIRITSTISSDIPHRQSELLIHARETKLPLELIFFHPKQRSLKFQLTYVAWSWANVGFPGSILKYGNSSWILISTFKYHREPGDASPIIFSEYFHMTDGENEDQHGEEIFPRPHSEEDTKLTCKVRCSFRTQWCSTSKLGPKS